MKKQTDALQSCFKTMWKGRLIRSPNDCCFPISLLYITPPTHRHMCIWKHKLTPGRPHKHSRRCCTWVPRCASHVQCVSSLHPSHSENKEDEEAEQSAPQETERNNETSAFNWERKRRTDLNGGMEEKGWQQRRQRRVPAVRKEGEHRGRVEWITPEWSSIMHVWDSP